MADVSAAPELTKNILGHPVIVDMGYDSDKFRQELMGNNNIPVIPGRKKRKKAIEYARQRYKKRSFIERQFGKIKENRRLTVRYEKSDINFLNFILVVFIKIHLC